MDSLINYVRTLPPTGSWFVAALTFFCSLFRYDLIQDATLVASTSVVYDAYDFIVIGGGTAGSVMASRLSENPSWSVLLLEAGGQETLNTEIPTLYNTLLGGDLAWRFPVERQSGACLGWVGNTCVMARGKVLGGTSTVGAMIYTRGNRRDFDSWAALGNEGWSYDDVLPYFIKSEDQQDPQYAADTKYHGTGGYLPISNPLYRTPLADYFLQAGKEMGYRTRDINGEFQTGFTVTQRIMRGGSRCSASKAFLLPASERPNLHILLHSQVTKINIDPVSKRAVSVLFMREGQMQTILSRQEIILSAGTINSPHILMLSGVGPKEHLSKMNISTVQDAFGVGENFQDKLSFGFTSFSINESISFVGPRFRNMNSITQYSLFGNGPLSTTIGGEVVGYVHSSISDISDDYPDIQLDIGPSHPSSLGLATTESRGGLPLEVAQTVFGPMEYTDGFTVYPIVLRPKSRGWIKLRSNDPFEYPAIYPNFLSHPDDVSLIIEGAQLVQEMTQTSALQSIGATLNPNKYIGCTHLELASRGYWECVARLYTGVIFHAIGTCKMGPKSDSMAVVDPRLRVYGIEGLRVVDASVMPNMVNANVMATVFMIAEKAADMIKEDNGATSRILGEVPGTTYGNGYTPPHTYRPIKNSIPTSNSRKITHSRKRYFGRH